MKNGDHVCCSKLSVCNLATAVGIVWGLAMFFCALLTMLFGIGSPFVDIFSSIYWGLDSTIIGALLGLLWGFIGGFLFGGLVAFFYNYCAANCPCTSCKTNRKCCR